MTRVLNKKKIVEVTEELESSIRSVVAAVRTLESSKLTEDTIVTLIHRHCSQPGYGRSKVGKNDVREVLDIIGNLDRLCLKQPKKNEL